MVKNSANTKCDIHYYDIGDYLSREQKLEKVGELGNISHVEWQSKTPDSYHDWLNPRGEMDAEWGKMIPIGSKEGKRNKTDHVLFSQYSLGLATHRDVWVYNASETELTKNMKRHIDYCGKQDPDSFQIDPKQATWTAELSTALKKLPQLPILDKSKVRTALYRPFFRQYLYFDPTFVAAKYRISLFYPTGSTVNPAIMVPDKIKGEFSAMMTDITPDLHVHEASQAFPLKAKKQNREDVRPVEPNQLTHSQPTESGDNRTGQDQGRVLGIHNGHYAGSGGSTPRPSISNESDGMRDNITDWALEQYQDTYKDHSITKEDIFYYTYGVLHHPGFRKKYQAFLVRGLPNIPMAPDFRTFEKAGRALADLHLNYETCPKYDLGNPLCPIPDAPRDIAYGKKANDGPGPKTIVDQTKILLDGIIVYDNLPHTTYKVNGRTPIGWFVDRYRYRDDPATGITNWPLEGATGVQVRGIIERLVYVGVESDNIISKLPSKFEMNADSPDSVLVQSPQTTLTGESQMRFEKK